MVATFAVHRSDDPSGSDVLHGGDVLAEKYLLVEPIGAGGMGQVWLARNLMTGAEVAAKVLLPSRIGSTDGVARLRNEARATAKLSHRAIVRVFDLIELDPASGSLVMVMELLRGRTLARRLEDEGPLPVDETRALVSPLLSALTHAHGHGIVHRDLKPENILLAVEPDGRVMPKILDFGISKVLRAGSDTITGRGEIVGTLCYMSPEQARAEPIDARSDVFSVGVLIYECLTGRNPFVTDGPMSVEEMMRATWEQEPRRDARIPPLLWPVIRRALAVRPADRHPAADAFAEALEGAAPSLSPDETWGRRSVTPNQFLTPPVPFTPAPLERASRVATMTAFAGRPRRAFGPKGAVVLAAVALFAAAVTLTSLGSRGAGALRASAAHATRVEHAKTAQTGSDRLKPQERAKPVDPSARGRRARSIEVARTPGF